MHEITFQTKLLKDGHLYCPKEYASPKAIFKVIVSLPDNENVEESTRPFGLCKGEFYVPEDFDAPLPTDFWQSPRLDELAVSQGVEPMSDLNIIAGTWPGTDEDRFEEDILAMRALRKAHEKETGR